MKKKSSAALRKRRQTLLGKLPKLRPQIDYVPQNRLAETKKFLANYQRAREILEQICEINRELLRRREAL